MAIQMICARSPDESCEENFANLRFVHTASNLREINLSSPIRNERLHGRYTKWHLRSLRICFVAEKKFYLNCAAHENLHARYAPHTTHCNSSEYQLSSSAEAMQRLYWRHDGRTARLTSMFDIHLNAIRVGSMSTHRSLFVYCCARCAWTRNATLRADVSVQILKTVMNPSDRNTFFRVCFGEFLDRIDSKKRCPVHLPSPSDVTWWMKRLESN